MAKWLKDYLSFGSKRMPPQPPKPDYTESEILKAYRVQKNLDFEDPYEDAQSRARSESTAADLAQPTFGSPLKSASLDMRLVSPKHRLIKVDSQDLGRSKIFLSAVSLDEPPGPVAPSAPAAGDTDYSDPFDVRLDGRQDSVLGPAPAENNGYMEPYEAQRVITELQRVPSAGCSRGGIQLYDTPYEERGRRWVAEEGRESRLPQDDERPADEYDQPWEWKKDHISKAFAVDTKECDELLCTPKGGADPEDQVTSLPRDTVTNRTLSSPCLACAVQNHRFILHQSPPQGSVVLKGYSICKDGSKATCCHSSLTFVVHAHHQTGAGITPEFDGADWELSSPPTERHLVSRSAPLQGAAAKLRKLADPHAVLGERVDPTLPLEKQVWYHGTLSRSEAEALLSLCKECSYLVRNSQTSRSDYSLSLRSCQGFMHMKFTLSKEGKYILGQNSPPFDTIPEAVHYYTTHKLPVRGAEHLSLLFPVVVQTL